MVIRDLSGASMEQLHEAMLDAYSDYVVPMPISRAQFEHMLTQRAFVPAYSRGVFEDEKLVAFWFVGLSEAHGPETLYAISVGTRPQWRRRGLAEALFRQIVQVAPDEASDFVLECITTNDKALAAYEKLGFQKSRRVILSRGSYSTFQASPAFSLEDISLHEARDLAGTLQVWSPTWQNSFGALDAFPNEARCLLARNRDGNPEGLACFARGTGQLHQLAVPHGPKRKEIMATLFHGAETDSEELRYFVNIDAEDGELLDLLASHGWDHYGAQYEMRLVL